MTSSGDRSPLVWLAAIIIFANACQKTPPPSTAVVALVDLSGSIPSETVDFYATTLTSVVWEKLTSRDRLVVLPVDSEAESKSEPLFSRDLSRTDFSDPKDGFAHKEEKERARVLDFMTKESPALKESVVSAAGRRKANRSATDLIGGLHAAVAAFPEQPNTKRVLLIFSDMVQESAELNIRQLAKTGEAGAETLAGQLVKRGRVPDLKGVSVVVVGAGETGIGGDNAAFFRAVRAFWKSVLSQAGASVDDRHYGYRTQGAIPDLLKSTSR